MGFLHVGFVGRLSVGALWLSMVCYADSNHAVDRISQDKYKAQHGLGN